MSFSDLKPVHDLIPGPRRTWVEIDLGALRRNADRFARRLPDGGRLIVSAKKDGYGHGLIAVARALAPHPRFGCFGVATPEEALTLRAAGIDADILCFSVLAGESLRAAILAGVILTVTDLADAQAAAAAAGPGRPARMHLKLDTGMGRLGRLEPEILEQIPAIVSTPGARIEGLYTHLADSWNDPDGGRRQWARLLAFRDRAGLGALPCHPGGSDALALGPLEPGTWLRSGIALFGDHAGFDDLEPVMTFKTRVIFRRSVPAGTAISYGLTQVTNRPTELALIGVGYGNGYLRALSGRAEVVIGGARRPLLGRVCMDQCVVDVTDGPPVAVGEEVVLFGRQGSAVLPAAEVARWAGTISYELFCLAGQINPRIESAETAVTA